MSAEPPGPNTTLQHYPWIVVRFACTACRVHANVRLAVLVERYGATETIERLLARFHANCPHRPVKRNGRPMRRDVPCGGYCPDLGSTRPPDLPPSLAGLTVISGGKEDMLPGYEEPADRRRRVGGDE
ncbi:MAG: hypothetical protein GY873_30020 [Bosea sp.]|uniref:hypothetical protein n=1 Tax=Bosea sp. (in: a-proteobacteria) TaxID=1871050 RepID=UPI00239CC4A2|nr:hypothetical protein [Bosea sp. (in: a-proteobacteria)]MCP4738432.1 hypothetical protein [Bosea sp. (in: a-proteobacteria)]